MYDYSSITRTLKNPVLKLPVFLRRVDSNARIIRVAIIIRFSKQRSMLTVKNTLSDSFVFPQ